MIAAFTIGMCIAMHGAAYRIEAITKETYLLAETLTVFEEDRTYREHWLIKYIDKNASLVPKGLKSMVYRN